MIPIRRRVRTVALVTLVLLTLGACRADWSQWGGNVERQGASLTERAISASNVGSLRHLWATDLGGYINAAPIVAIDIPVNGVKTDLIFVGTEQGIFSAIKTDGQILWSRNLGNHVANCPDTPGSVYGIQASAAWDRDHNRVLVVGGDGKAYALDPATGTTNAGWPVTVTTDPVHNSIYGAPTLFRNYLYVETGSYCDQRPYHGSVVRIDTTTRATKAWYATGGSATGPDGGGIWGWGGASVDPRDGNVYVATGNLFATPENAPYGDAVVRLTGDLNVVASNAPGVLIGDDDFGSTPMLFQKPGCPPQLAVEQKNGSLYLYNRDSIASGPVQALKPSIGQDAVHLPAPVDEFIGVPAWSPDTQMLYLANPTGTPDGAYVNGMVAFRLNASCRLEKAWNTFAGVKSYVVGTPTVANGVVYYPAGGANRVYAFDALTGQPLWNSDTTLTRPVFTAPTVINGRVYVGSYDNKLHAWGL